ncbi:MAG TPA: ABC transporter permease, partial [Candidatus Eremiobacteraceae bacterium]|nr:ABC transporter permease [Candidatus Eremiobacteraceae bacterium]
AKTRFGRYVYAVGGNDEAARRAGIPTQRIRAAVFGISGLAAGVTSVMLVGYSQAASTTTAGADLLLDAITIAVIGGVSLSGGKGSVWSVLVGGLVIASLDSGLNLLAVDPTYVYTIKGVMLLVAIALDVFVKRTAVLAYRR